MCGVAGAFGSHQVEQFVRTANSVQHHRGPDARGVLVERVGGVNIGLSHQRLSIIDLSEQGSQPMESQSGRYTIVYNGEIYNYLELRKEHGLDALHSNTDTEVVLELIDRLGIEEACRKFNGMWAMLVYDRKDNKLWLSRDRFGKKPLYYLVHKDTAYVASELKSFLPIEGFEWRVNALSAARFLSQSLQDVDEQSWIEKILSLPAGCNGEIDLSDPAKGVQNISPYWTLEASEDKWDQSEDKFIEELNAVVSDAIAIRLRSDVPVGIALSGGLDSSIIAAVTSQLNGSSGNQTKLFSATNPGAEEDESHFAMAMAQHLGCDLDSFSLDANPDEDLLQLLQLCNFHNDAPVSSFSAVLFFKLMESARDLGITVILTGQGADEAYCGYRKYPILEAKRLLQSGSPIQAMKLMAGFVKEGTILSQFKFSEAKRYMGSTNASLLGPRAKAAGINELLSNTTSGLAARQILDLTRYSVPYLTHYEDRMSMACSREVRAPFLDYRVVEMGVNAPTRMKMQSGWTKYALRKAFEKDLPNEITWRKDKQGFVNPQDAWMKSRLSTHIEDMNADPNAPIFAEGLVDRQAYQSMFSRYCDGDKKIWFRDIFAPFSLNVWLTSFREGSSVQLSTYNQALVV